MRPIAALTMAMTAALMAGAVTPAIAAAGEPAEVRWENRIAEQSPLSDAANVAVSPDGSTAYAVGEFRAEAQDQYETPFVHAVDVATGSTRWSTTLEPGLSVGDIAVDPTSGQVVTAGTRWTGSKNEAVVTVFSPTGEQVWTAAVPGRQLWDLALDPTTGRVCVATATGTGSIWSTQCWSSSGQAQFANDYRSHSNSWPNAIVIDEITHRIFVAGARSKRSGGVVTTLAFNAQGRALWNRSSALEEDYPYVQDVAIDAKKKRLYLLLDEDRRALVIAQRTTNGKTAFRHTFGSGKPKTPRPKFVDVLPGSHRVVVTSHAKPRYRGTLRYLDKRGRQVALANFRECCDLTRPVVDPATDRLSIAWGPGTFDDGVPTEDEGVGAASWDSTGAKMTDLEVSPPGKVREVAAIAAAGADLLVLGDRAFSSTDGAGSFLVAVR